MSMFRKIAAASLISLTLAAGSIATVTPALAHGGGGGGHGGGGHEGGFGMSSHFGVEGNRGGAFFGGDHFAGRVRDHRPFFFGDDDYYYDQCQWQWSRNTLGHPVRIEVCY